MKKLSGIYLAFSILFLCLLADPTPLWVWVAGGVNMLLAWLAAEKTGIVEGLNRG